MEQISSLVKAILVLFVLRNVYALVGLLKNSGLKNVSAIIKKIKKTAIGIIMVPILPFIVGQGIRGVVFTQSHINLSLSGFLLIILGIILFMGAGLIKNFDNSATLKE